MKLADAQARTMGTIFFILLLCDRTEEMIISDYEDMKLK